MRLKNKDIARELNISTTAVSLAINNRPGVSEETRKRVLQLITENSKRTYQSLIPDGGTGGTVLLSVHKKHGAIMNEKPFFADLIETIQQEARRLSYMVSIVYYMPGQDLDDYINYLRSLQAVGMIVIATEMDETDLQAYMQLDYPIVLSDSSFELANVDSVSLDNQTAVLRAFDYAYQMGHRNIGFLQSSTFINNFEHRFDGFIKGIRKYRLKEYVHPVVSLPCNFEGAYEEMRKLLQKEKLDFEMPTIFLSDLDYIAMGAMKALKEAGYRIPQDVSIIGIDDVIGCEGLDPPLTTIRVNRMDVGRLAVQTLAEKLRNPGDYYITTTVSSTLIVRESVRNIN